MSSKVAVHLPTTAKWPFQLTDLKSNQHQFGQSPRSGWLGNNAGSAAAPSSGTLSTSGSNGPNMLGANMERTSSSTPESHSNDYGRPVTTAARCLWALDTCKAVPSLGTHYCSMHQNTISSSPPKPLLFRQQKMARSPEKSLSGVPKRGVLTGKAARKSVQAPAPRPLKPPHPIAQPSSKTVGEPISMQSKEPFGRAHSPPDSPSQRSLAVKNDKLHRGSSVASGARTNGAQPTLLPKSQSPSGNKSQFSTKPRDTLGQLQDTLNQPAKIIQDARLASGTTGISNGAPSENASSKSSKLHLTPRKTSTRPPPAVNGVHGINGVNGVNGINGTNGINGMGISFNLNGTSHLPRVPVVPSQAIYHMKQPDRARQPAPQQATPEAPRTTRPHTSTPTATPKATPAASPATANKYRDEVLQLDRNGGDPNESLATPPSRWSGQMSNSRLFNGTQQTVQEYVDRELSELIGKSAEIAKDSLQSRKRPHSQITSPRQPSGPIPTAKPAVKAARPTTVKQKPYDPSKPPVEQERLRRVAKFDQTSFDAFLYNQQGASTPPQGVLVSPLPVRSLPGDPPAFLPIDPRVHYDRPHSETWLKRKQGEIKARGSKKANFGRAAENAARHRRQQEDCSLEESLPDYVQSNPAWMNAQKWFADVNKSVQEDWKQKANLQLQQDQAAQIQEQLEREAARSSS